MKALIIGGTGNISTAVVATLRAQGWDVTLCGRGEGVPGCGFLRVDRTQHAEFERVMAAHGPWDCVIDMIGYTPEDAESAIRAFAGRTAQFVFCSTVDVFAKPAPSYPIGPGAPLGADPRFGYAYNKVLMEERLEAAAASSAFALTIVRPAATFNDHSAPIGILSHGVAVLRRIRLGLPVLVMGDGLSLWCTAHRDDVGHAIARAAGNLKAYGKHYTLASGEAMTWRQYYDAFRVVMKAPPIRFVGVPTALLAAAAPLTCEWCDFNFQYDNVFDSDDARRDLDFHITIGWQECARHMVAYHDSTGAIDSAMDHPAYEPIVRRMNTLRQDFTRELAGLDR